MIQPPTVQQRTTDFLRKNEHSCHSHRLNLEQLNTQPFSLSKQYKIRTKQLYNKHNNQSSQTHKQYSNLVTTMQSNYYSSSLILLQNQIEFHQPSECLKRYYSLDEYHNKITMLGEYYKFHQDQPRIFLQEVDKIVCVYQEDRRELEYVRVREKIEEERKKEGVDGGDGLRLTNRGDSRSNGARNDRAKVKKSEKILKNIQLSYVDFENKQKKHPKKQTTLNEKQQPKQMKRKASTNCISNAFIVSAINKQKQKKMLKSNSLNAKNIFSNNHLSCKSRQTSKQGNQTKSPMFSLKQIELKENKNLKSKYTHIIGELFNKKTSLRNNDLPQEKFAQQQENTILRKPVENKHQVYLEGEIQNRSNGSHVRFSNDFQQNEETYDVPKLNIENVKDELHHPKIPRTKSQTTMNTYQSSNLLKTIKPKLQEKAIINQLNSKSSSKYQSKCSSKHKNQQHINERVLKRDKFLSSKSLKEQKETQKHVKTVRIFQITKKDLIIEAENSSVNKDSENQKNHKQTQKCKHQQKQRQNNIQPSTLDKHPSQFNKQNHPNETNPSKDKKRTFSFKKGSQLHLVNKKKETQKEVKQKQPSTFTMFGRVIKTKIRG